MKIGYFVTQATPKGLNGGKGLLFTGAIKVPEAITPQDFHDMLRVQCFEPSSDIISLKNPQEMQKKVTSVMKSKFEDGLNNAWHNTCSRIKEKLLEMKWWTFEEFEEWRSSKVTHNEESVHSNSKREQQSSPPTNASMGMREDVSTGDASGSKSCDASGVTNKSALKSLQ